MEREHLTNQRHRRHQMNGVVAEGVGFEMMLADRQEENQILLLNLAGER